MKYLFVVGGALFLWGAIDLALSYMGTDLYEKIGIQLSDGIYPFTHWIAMGLGLVLVRIGARYIREAAENAAQSDSSEK